MELNVSMSESWPFHWKGLGISAGFVDKNMVQLTPVLDKMA